MKLSPNALILICTNLPFEKLFGMNLVNKTFYENIIPSTFLYLNRTMKFYKLDSKIIIDYSIITKFYK